MVEIERLKIQKFKNAYVICTLIKKKVQVFSLDHRYHKATNYILDLGKLDDDFYKKYQIYQK